MTPSNLYFVGIGASAGGLESMLKLLANLSHNGRVAYVVAQHMAKDGHIELVLRLLNRQSNLPVVEAKSNDLIEPDHVYLIPPSCIGVLQKGRIQLLPSTSDYISSPSVNALFNSIATEAEKNGIGIILSGTGIDGVVGCRAIKAHGGMIMAQSPLTAPFEGMPSAVIGAYIADQILAPEEMARHLNALFPTTKTFPAAYVPITATGITATVLPLTELVKEVFEATGVDFSSYKEEILQRRVDRRILSLKLASFGDYQAYIQKNANELHILQHFFLVSLSSFFRDSGAFAVISKLLGELVKQKKQGDTIRIWVPGCASGEECYTIAILLAEHLGTDFARYNIEITGSDLNPDALDIAESGSYRLTAFKEVNPDILKRYFEHQGQHFKVNKHIRNMCHFIKQDVVSSIAPENLDVISCQNLLIYMKSSLQDQLFKKFHRALLPQGLLFIGQSENIGLLGNTLFNEVDNYYRLYRRKD
jgi:chemotaxis protein methyltransferase CheR/two-component system CheB/CheR fusion protein